MAVKARPSKLIMSFDPTTIEHLGVKMYSNLPNALAELIANGYDADAKAVSIKLYDKSGEKSIEIIDNGEGMSFEEINNQFLRIGRNRRKEGMINSPSGKRKATGKKGLGKLAFFGIANTIIIETIKKGSGKKITFKMDWDELINETKTNYEPHYSIFQCDKKLKGTTVKLFNLKRTSVFEKEELAISISKLFNFPSNEFKLTICLNDDKSILIHNKFRFENLEKEFEWNFHDFVNRINSKYSEKSIITGKIIATKKPLKPGLRGITLFANGRLVNAPEYFGVSESSHGFSYLTGWLDVDFVDNWEEDVIATDRQTLNWELPKPNELREFLKKCISQLEVDWRKKRNENRQKEIKSRTNVDVPKWFGKLPAEILSNLQPIVNSVMEKSELALEEQTDIMQKLHSLIPKYPYYHWRHLHNAIHEVSENDYQKEDYFRAAQEAVKKYVKEVQKKSKAKHGSTGKTLDGKDLMFNAFGQNGILKFTKNKTSSEKDLEDGQQHLSAGIVAGFRNPTSHESKKDLHPKIFSDKDCLDILSLASYLFEKLDISKKKK